MKKGQYLKKFLRSAQADSAIRCVSDWYKRFNETLNKY